MEIQGEVQGLTEKQAKAELAAEESQGIDFPGDE